MESRSRSSRLIAGTILAVGLAYLATFLFYALRARFQVPYVDDWSWLASLFDRPSETLWQPHNEHIIVLPRILLWLDYLIWGWPGYATLAAALVSQLLVATVFASVCRTRPLDEARFLVGCVLTLTFSTYSLQGTVFAGAVLFPMVIAFATIAVWSIAQCAAQPPHRWWRYVALGAIASGLGMLCLTNAVLLPMILAGGAVALRLPRRYVFVLAAVFVCAVIGRLALSGTPDTPLAGSAVATLRFFLAILAGPAASLSPRLSVPVGGTILALSTWCVWRFLRAPVKRPSDAFLAGWLVFAIGSSAMAALGRAQFDLSVAAESRYVEIVAVGWASLLLFLLPAGLFDSRRGRAVAFTILLVAMAGLPAQIFVGRIWAAKADHLSAAGLALAVGVRDADWITELHPLGGAYIEPVLPRLFARHVDWLAVPELGQSRVAGPNVAECRGSLEAVRLTSMPPAVQLRGGLVDPGQRLRVVDSGGRVIGIARSAPSVEHARPRANDFVWAELESWTNHAQTQPRWLGFATWGSGPPFSAELIDDQGQLVCTAPVSCCSAPEQAGDRPELVVRGNLLMGWLDSADCTTISGWSVDEGRPNARIAVRITTSKGTTLTADADRFREDLRAIGKGDGRHGFAVPTSALQLSAGRWQVRAEIASTGVELSGSPKEVVCP